MLKSASLFIRSLCRIKTNFALFKVLIPIYAWSISGEIDSSILVDQLCPEEVINKRRQ